MPDHRLLSMAACFNRPCYWWWIAHSHKQVAPNAPSHCCQDVYVSVLLMSNLQIIIIIINSTSTAHRALTLLIEKGAPLFVKDKMGKCVCVCVYAPSPSSSSKKMCHTLYNSIIYIHSGSFIPSLDQTPLDILEYKLNSSFVESMASRHLPDSSPLLPSLVRSPSLSLSLSTHTHSTSTLYYLNEVNLSFYKNRGRTC